MNRIDNRIESTYPLKEESDNVRSFAWVKYAAAAVAIGISSLFSAWYFSSPNLGKELMQHILKHLKNKENTIRGNSDMGEILTWEQRPIMIIKKEITPQPRPIMRKYLKPDKQF
ncbi:MAG: hypothetical protein IPO64_12790 [Bacteroidetes bacterium]|nr:hypothetical protein [Bacteroidota bacterium]